MLHSYMCSLWMYLKSYRGGSYEFVWVLQSYLYQIWKGVALIYVFTVNVLKKLSGEDQMNFYGCCTHICINSEKALHSYMYQYECGCCTLKCMKTMKALHSYLSNIWTNVALILRTPLYETTVWSGNIFKTLRVRTLGVRTNRRPS